MGKKPVAETLAIPTQRGDGLGGGMNFDGSKGLLIPQVRFIQPTLGDNVEDYRKFDREFLGQLEVLVTKLNRVGRAALTFVEQPRFHKCFNGTGHDSSFEPIYWVDELKGVMIRVALAAHNARIFLESYRPTMAPDSDGMFPLTALFHSCERIIQLGSTLGSDFSSQLDDMEWYISDEDENRNWDMFLSPDNYLVVPEDPMDDPYGFEYRKSVHNYHVKVGKLQLTILNELKVVAESAVFTERLLGLIREGVGVILGALGHDSTTVPTPNKQTEPPVKSPNPLTPNHMAILGGMVYFYDNEIVTLTVKLLHEYIKNKTGYANSAKTTVHDMKVLKDWEYIVCPIKSKYYQLTEMGRSLFPRSS